MKQILAFILLVITIPLYSQLNQKLRNELLIIYKSDQERNISPADPDFINQWNKLNVTDSLNMMRVAVIIDSVGYPGKSLVGDTACTTGFFVIQHSNLKNREKYLPILKNAADANELEWKYVAMLIDRIKVEKQEKQIYGTQLQCIKNPGTGYCTDKIEFCPIEDPGNVNKRRKQVGLKSIEEYAKEFGIEYK